MKVKKNDGTWCCLADLCNVQYQPDKNEESQTTHTKALLDLSARVKVLGG